MSSYHLSQKAKVDLQEIGRYTRKKWGKSQATSYVIQLRACCERLIQTPEIGRLSPFAQFSLRRIEQGSHVIFYLQQDQGILIIRILHKAMLPEIHSLNEL